MLTCLDTWIGMQGCDDSTSDSGVFINDLPGIELKRIADLVNEDDTTVDLIWSKIKSNGLRKFYTDVSAEFAKRYQIKSVSKSIDLGRVVEQTTTPSGVNYQGFVYELNQEGSVYTSSNLKLISIQTLRLYLPSALNTTVKVFDLDTQEELYSYALTGVSGWNTISVNRQFDAYRIFVCYDATTIASVTLDVTHYHSCYGCEGRLKGATATIASPYVVTTGENTFGLSAVISENCSFNKIICNNKVNFTTALLYSLGIAFVDEVMGNTSLNRTTTVDRDVMQQQRVDYMLKYMGGTTGTENAQVFVKGELKQAIAGINLEGWDACLECNSEVSTNYATV